MRIPKILWLIAVAVALVAALVPAASQAAGVGGKFKVNGKPRITSITLDNAAMIPNNEYVATVHVSNPEGKDELKDLVVKIYYDASGANTDRTEFNAAAASKDQCAVITWTQAGNTVVLAADDSVLWALGDYTIPATLADDFVFEFTVGKIAKPTEAPAKWEAAAVATDDALEDGFGHFTNGATMSFFGEADIQLLPPDVDFGVVPSGEEFADNNNEATPVAVTYIANDVYTENISASSPWDDGTNNATLDPLGVCDGDNEFALKAFVTDTYASAVLVVADPGTVLLATSDAGTTEDGDLRDAQRIWLKVSLGYDVTDDYYAGTITYAIANGT